MTSLPTAFDTEDTSVFTKTALVSQFTVVTYTAPAGRKILSWSFDFGVANLRVAKVDHSGDTLTFTVYNADSLTVDFTYKLSLLKVN